MILSQICETMIQMSRNGRWGVGLVALGLLWMAGCCGGGSTHKCDFTPAPIDAGNQSDAGFGCPSQPCAANQVCCVAKTPPFISCINPADFVADGCEKNFMTNSPPCVTPQDCDGGVCCLQINVQTFSCQLPAGCSGDGTESYWTCSTDRDCPGRVSGSCQPVSAAAQYGLSLSVCTP
jgi:hypothetical protein